MKSGYRDRNLWRFSPFRSGKFQDTGSLKQTTSWFSVISISSFTTILPFDSMYPLHVYCRRYMTQSPTAANGTLRVSQQNEFWTHVRVCVLLHVSVPPYNFWTNWSIFVESATKVTPLKAKTVSVQIHPVPAETSTRWCYQLQKWRADLTWNKKWLCVFEKQPTRLTQWLHMHCRNHLWFNKVRGQQRAVKWKEPRRDEEIRSGYLSETTGPPDRSVCRHWLCTSVTTVTATLSVNTVAPKYSAWFFILPTDGRVITTRPFHQTGYSGDNWRMHSGCLRK